ncbi:MAG: CRP/FNR family cyclic AMP-dependent transcriptional regulator [Pseudohongiellaceae bacterium]|jgi:CRP/FNR family cyclic AMP-dependent transcriptional regulator
MAVTPELLSIFAIFKPLPGPVLAELAIHATLSKFARRGVVLRAGETEDHICLLFEGRLQGVDFTIDGREVGLYFVEPGEFCGELGIFDQGPQPEFVIALTPAVVVCVPMTSLRELLLKAPSVVNVLGQKLATRVRQMIFQRSLLALPSVPQKVCCQLWGLVREIDKKSITPVKINNPPTHMEIAIMLNLSRETVTRVFQTLQNRQIVKRDGSALLLVNDVAALEKLANGGESL